MEIEKLCKYIFLVNLLIALGYLLYGSMLGYSYWFDELFSVSLAVLPFAEMVKPVLRDSHPPGYSLLLAVWVRIFGPDETVTRALSGIAALAAIILLLPLRRIFAPRPYWLTLALFTSAPLWVIYAQEARPYGLLLCFSTGALVFVLNRQTGMAIAFATAAGLTHYFGAVLAYVLFAVMVLFDGLRGKALLATCMAALVVAAPAAYQIAMQAFPDEKLTNWIQSTPLNAVEQSFAAAHHLFFVAILLPVFGLRSWFVLTAESKRTIAIWLGVVGAVAVVNLIRPVSTERNFIVLVPAGAILLSLCLDRLFEYGYRRAVFVVGFLAWSLGLAAAFWGTVMERFNPIQDWRTSVVLAQAEAQVTGGTLYARVGPVPAEGFLGRFVAAHYTPGGQALRNFPVDAVNELRSGDVVFFGHELGAGLRNGICHAPISDMLEQAGVPHRAAYTEQAWRCQNGVIVVD